MVLLMNVIHMSVEKNIFAMHGGSFGFWEISYLIQWSKREHMNREECLEVSGKLSACEYTKRQCLSNLAL